MERLLDLVSPGTKERLRQLMDEQEKVVGAAVHEALATVLKGPEFMKQVNEGVLARSGDMIENYLEWRLEDADYDSDEFEPLREFVKQGIKHLVASEKAKKLASEAIKASIENYFENLNEGDNEEFEDEVHAMCADLYRQQLERIRDNGNLELNQDIRERIEQAIKENIQEKVDEDWG